MDIVGFKDSLLESFRREAGNLLGTLNGEQRELAERTLLRYSEQQLVLLSSRFDSTIDRDEVEKNIEHIFATLSSLGEAAGNQVKDAIKNAVIEILNKLLLLAAKTIT